MVPSGNPKYTESKTELLIHNFEMINAKVVKEGGNQTLVLLVSTGKIPMLLFNKIENNKDWITYYSSDLSNNIPSID